MKSFLVLALFVLALAACAPATQDDAQAGDVTPPAEAAPISEAAQAAQATADEAFLLMEVGKVRSGEYSPNALAELTLPRGVLWTIESFGVDDYSLRVVSQEEPNLAWLVTQEGVELVTSTANGEG